MFEETFEEQEAEALDKPSHEMWVEHPLEEEPDTDSASETDNNKYGLKPFLLAKFKNNSMDISGDCCTFIDSIAPFAAFGNF